MKSILNVIYYFIMASPQSTSRMSCKLVLPSSVIADSDNLTEPLPRRQSCSNMAVDIDGTGRRTLMSGKFQRQHPTNHNRHHWTSLLVLACLSLSSTPVLVTATASASDQKIAIPHSLERHHVQNSHMLRHHNAHHQHRHQRRSLEQEFTGEWNGQWYADGSTSNYGCNGNNCNDDDGTGSSSKSRSSGMWIDNVNPDSLTPEQIITYVSLGLLAFMTMLFCCVCYPELVLMGMKKLFCGCCGLGGKGTAAAGGGVDDEGLEGGADYVRQDDKRVKRKSKSTPTSKSKSKSKSSKDVELV